MVTRRTFVARVLSTTAAAALPAGSIAHALPAEAEPEPIPVAPGVDVLSHHPVWNTVETVGIDEDRRDYPDMAWYTTGYLFAHSDDHGRSSARQIVINGYADGSMRIGFLPVNPFDRLPTRLGYSAIHLNPAMATAVWQGIFGEDVDESMPTERVEPQPWDEERYRSGQRRIYRMRHYAKVEEQIVAEEAAERAA